ncbi:MAG TPA: hypothetical protein VHA78_01945 [Candidatus Peribacteraceae bacterium]|nr:hypothetical protein [Candidatus Peribacteraceae bacterium]
MPLNQSSTLETEFTEQPDIIVDTHIAKPQSDERLLAQSMVTTDIGSDNPKNAAGHLIERLSASPTASEYVSVLKESQVIGSEAERLVWGFVRREVYTQSPLAHAALHALAECGDHGAERAVREMHTAEAQRIRDSVRNQPVIRGCCGDH